MKKSAGSFLYVFHVKKKVKKRQKPGAACEIVKNITRSAIVAIVCDYIKITNFMCKIAQINE